MKELDFNLENAVKVVKAMGERPCGRVCTGCISR
jgi:hypothetical protein